MQVREEECERKPAVPTDTKAAPRPTKPSRRTPAHQTRLILRVGEEMHITPNHVVRTILGETGLPPSTVGTVDIRARHLFVDVDTEHAGQIIQKLNRTRINGHPLKAKLA